MLHIVICVKVVMDPEAPVSTFRIDTEKRRAIPGQGIPPVLNPYDENSLEAALKIKEQQPAKITIISAGKSIPKAIIRKCLAVGADDLIILEDELFDEIDGYSSAYILAAAIRKMGEYDLILSGRMAADTNAGLVGPGLAELLGIPNVTIAQSIEIKDGKAHVKRALADGCETIEMSLPCLVTVSHEMGELRSADIKGLMAAQKQPLTTWNAADLEIDTTLIRQKTPLKLYIPEKDINCEMVTGETPEESGVNLAVKLLDQI